MAKLSLTFACGLYDRMLPLVRGDVEAAGIDINFICLEGPAGAREIFDRMSGRQEFDVSEYSFSEYTSRFVAGDSPFVALPVFPLKVYRHNCLTINRKSGIKTPKDLEGRRVGVPVYVMSASVWLRGHLQEDYGVDLSTIQWVEGATNRPGSHGTPSVLPLLRPANIVPNKSGKSLSELLADGEIDAICGPHLPNSLATSPDVVRLFPNFKEIEKNLYRSRRIFPIMHLIALRRDVYEKYPFIASSLYDAFCASKDMALARMKETATLQYMMPWMVEHIEEIDDVFVDGDPWAYGIEPNRQTIEAFQRYLTDQAIIATPQKADDLFLETYGHYNRNTGKRVLDA